MGSFKFFESVPNTPIAPVTTFPGNRQVFMKRLDLTHQHVSGNKWFKLKYNFKLALDQLASGVVTFGGAYSNHIYATAAAGYYCGLPTVGFIRGEIKRPLNPTLAQAQAWGMKLIPLSREEYRLKSNNGFLKQLKESYVGYHFLPEGGSNKLALKGCKEMLTDRHFDYWCLSCGTGGTLAGLVSALPQTTKVLGVAALKGANFLEKEIQELLGNNLNSACPWTLILDYHFGGYAKTDPELFSFMKQFQKKYAIPLDPIYTGKMVYGVFDLISKEYFPEECSILMLHSGGLQGSEGIREKYGKNII